MASSTGQNLDILINAQVSTDWQTFAAWFSVKKNLPEATITLACMRNGETPFQLFQWAKRLNQKVLMYNRLPPEPNDAEESYALIRATGLWGKKVVVLKPYQMVIAPLDDNYLPMLQGEDTSIAHMWKEAKETTELSPLVGYTKGVGKWLHKSKGCPFSNAGGLASDEMTVNEHRIIDLWKRMTTLFSSVS